MTAFAKGAPLRVIGNVTVGSNNLFWYVKADNEVDQGGHREYDDCIFDGWIIDL